MKRRAAGSSISVGCFHIGSQRRRPTPHRLVRRRARAAADSLPSHGLRRNHPCHQGCRAGPPVTVATTYLDDRCRVHKYTIDLCYSVPAALLGWTSVQGSNLSESTRDVDLVITVCGDGTLLRANHLDSSVPMFSCS
ncbi:hypothetical protein SEVIR_2G189200v4 [Setaria viridis]|uniref:Uncharacterized protein n=2 Tax=Setaria TaxID=4554 RepID=A0A368Q2D9_SETIT|nr:hypothetical protein SETIT_2G182100v2 [Setaria italica]TKW32770.1 hypothetical protein SEVIR_2G189200v2 [Setaria viridis]